MPRGIKRVCYWGWQNNHEEECTGRKTLLYFQCSGKKEWICKICLKFLEDLWYCEGGLKLCDPACENRNCREDNRLDNTIRSKMNDLC